VFDEDKALQAASKRHQLKRGKKVSPLSAFSTYDGLHELRQLCTQVRVYILPSSTIGTPSVSVGAVVLGENATALRLCQEWGRARRRIATSEGQDKAKMIWLCVRTT
jgi:hypothetical protein